MAIEIFEDVGYVIITNRLNPHVSIFKNMGVAASGATPTLTLHLEPPLLKFLEVTPA